MECPSCRESQREKENALQQLDEASELMCKATAHVMTLREEVAKLKAENLRLRPAPPVSDAKH